MSKILNPIYEKFNLNSFKNTAILFSFLGDIFASGYIYFKFTNYQMFEDLMEKALLINGLDKNLIDQEFFKQQFAILSGVIVTMICAIIVIQLIHYILYKKETRYGIKYMKLLALIGAPGFFIFGVTIFFSSTVVALFAQVQALLYLFIFFGINRFHKQK